MTRTRLLTVTAALATLTPLTAATAHASGGGSVVTRHGTGAGGGAT